MDYVCLFCASRWESRWQLNWDERHGWLRPGARRCFGQIVLWPRGLPVPLPH